MGGDEGMADRRDRSRSESPVLEADRALQSILEDADTPGGASGEMIVAAEDRLAVRFPPTYRRFLATYGAALVQGCEIAGLYEHGNPEQCPYWTHVVDLNVTTREHSPMLPATYLRVGDDGCDCSYYLDLSHPDADGEYPVVVLGPGCDNLVLARTFVEFAARYVRGELDR